MTPPAAERRPDFAARAASYDELRAPDDAWWAVFRALVAEGDLRGTRVLDVGCGTGTLTAALAERAGAKVWGIDPTPEMLAVARAKAPRGAGFKLAAAEALPFTDRWFQRAVMTLVVHLVDRPRAFAEIRRVLGEDGRFALWTFAPEHFGRFYLNRLFPSLESIDRARFPTGGQLEDELAEAGFASVRIRPLSLTKSIDREEALRRIRGRHISTFDLIDEREYRAGLERAERELPARVVYPQQGLVVVAAT